MVDTLEQGTPISQLKSSLTFVQPTQKREGSRMVTVTQKRVIAH